MATHCAEKFGGRQCSLHNARGPCSSAALPVAASAAAAALPGGTSVLAFSRRKPGGLGKPPTNLCEQGSLATKFDSSPSTAFCKQWYKSTGVASLTPITVQPLDPEVAEAFQFFDTNDTKTIDKATFKKMVYSLGDLPLPVRCETVHRVAPWPRDLCFAGQSPILDKFDEFWKEACGEDEADEAK